MAIIDTDQCNADRERNARDHLIRTGAATLPRQPWLHPSQPPSSTDLVRYAVWQAQSRAGTDDDVAAALTLMESARAEIEHLETALLFTARARGLSWGRIARLLGLGSAQAAQQRLGRRVARDAANPGS